MYLEIENSVINALEYLQRTNGINLVEPYGGEFSPDDMGNSVVKMPAIFCHVDGMEAGENNLSTLDTYSIKIYAASLSSRSLPEATRGRTGNIGVYEMLRLIRGTLRNKLLENELLISPLRLINEQIVGYSKKNRVCVGLASYTILIEE